MIAKAGVIVKRGGLNDLETWGHFSPGVLEIGFNTGARGQVGAWVQARMSTRSHTHARIMHTHVMHTHTRNAAVSNRVSERERNDVDRML